MKNDEKRIINMEPVRTFFIEDIYPKEFAVLLDEFLYHYILLLIQSLKNDDTVIHENTTDFLHYLKTHRDILPECGI